MSDPRPRIAILRHCAEYELDVRREAEALASAGYAVDVFLVRRRGDRRSETVGAVTLVRVPGRKHRGSDRRYVVDYATFVLTCGAWFTIRHLRRRYRAVQVNTMPDALVFAAAVARPTRTPIVMFVQEPTPELAQALGMPARTVRLLAWIEQRALRFATASITVTEDLRERLVERGADRTRITVVLNGPDPEHLVGDVLPPVHTSRRGERFVVICHGTIEDRYGHDVLVEAVAKARTVDPSIELVITGRGAGEGALLADIDRLGLRDAVRFEGWVSEARLVELLDQADVGVVAQKASPYSHLVHTNKMYDDWIAGLPVIASRLDATARLFGSDEVAYFEPGDASSLAAQLVSLAASPERCAQLALAGRRAYERVGWSSQRTVYLGVFGRLLAGQEAGS